VEVRVRDEKWKGGNPKCSHSGARDLCFCGATRQFPEEHGDFYGRLDPGIRDAVRILKAGGIETYESCEGGVKHTFPEPTVRFYGDAGAGWLALSLALTHGLPVQALRRFWTVDDGEPKEPHWEMVFWKGFNLDVECQACRHGSLAFPHKGCGYDKDWKPSGTDAPTYRAPDGTRIVGDQP